MGKFQRSGKGGMPGISTASLPDIVFMLLFFFMVTTSVKTAEKMVKVKVPKASEAMKLEDASKVVNIFVGEPLQSAKWGKGTRIQLNDAYADANGIQDFIYSKREKMAESDKAKMIVNLGVDQEVKMGIITDVKLALRKAGALKINYQSQKTNDK